MPTVRQLAPRMRPALAAALALLALCAPTWANGCHALDDGSAETSILLVAGSEARPTLWLNAFDAPPGGDVITALQVTWGRTSGGPSGVPPGAPTTLYLYQDDPTNDGDPRTATLLVSAIVPNGAPASSIDTGVLLDLPIAPTAVSGKFFVAALYLDPGQGLPAPLDQTDPDFPGRSWVFSSAENSVDVNNLGAPTNFGGLIEDPPFLLPGNWLLRARGQAATTWCTAKTTSNGCLPAVAFTGALPSLSGQPFDLSATSLVNNKNGLFFYGTSGPAALPFLGGTLCVAPPLRRTPIHNSGGNPPPDDCSGAISFDFGAWLASGVDPLLVPGTLVEGQFWFRDPAQPDGSGAGLTDAVQLTVCP